MATTLEVLNITSSTGVELGRGAAASGANAVAIGAAVGTPTAGETTNGAFATGAGAIAIGTGAKATAAGAVQIGAGTNASANTIQFQGTHLVTDAQYNALRAFLADGMFQHGTITVSGVDATKFKTTTTVLATIAGVVYTKAAEDGIVFTTAGTINAAGADTTAHWGAWLVQMDTAGTVTTKAVGGGTTDQDYATEALAIAALPAADSGKVQIGYITVQGLASTKWTATTSNLTVGVGAGNCTARNFYNLPAVKTLPAAIA